QAEDGIRDFHVTGVQTCALPISTLMVMLGNQAFAFPLVNVNEIFHLDLSRTNVVDGQEVVIVRDKALPLFYLKRWLVNDAAQERSEERRVGKEGGGRSSGWHENQ